MFPRCPRAILALACAVLVFLSSSLALAQEAPSPTLNTDAFLLQDGSFLCFPMTTGNESFQLHSMEAPEWGTVEFDLESGQLLYRPDPLNNELKDSFRIWLSNTNVGQRVLEGSFDPATQQIQFSNLAVPAVKDEIVLVVENGGLQLESYCLENGAGDVISIIRQRIEGGAKIVGGYVRYQGQITYFGQDNIKEIFRIINPRVVEELERRRARRSEELDFLFGPRGSDMSAEEQRLLFELALVAVELGGILDPTQICDGAACLAELGQGNFVYAGINVIAMIPWLGDLAKAGKAPRFIRIVNEAIEHALKNARFAERIRPLLEILSEALGRLPESVAKHFDGLKQKIDDFLAKLASKGLDLGSFVGKQAKVAPHLPAGSYPALVVDGEVYVARMHIVAWEMAGKKGNEMFYGFAEIDAAGKIKRLFK